MQFAPLLIVVRLTLTLTWTIRTYYVDLSSSSSSSIFVYYNVVRRNTTHYNNKQ